MKLFRPSSFIFLVSLLTWFLVADVYASNKWPKQRGTLCWNVTMSNGTLAGVRTLRITNMGERHYLCNGKFVAANGTVSPVVGSAEINNETGNDRILITLTGTGSAGGDSMQAAHIYVTLDGSTLDGTEQRLGHRTTDTGVASDHGTATTTYVSCP